MPIPKSLLPHCVSSCHVASKNASRTIFCPDYGPEILLPALFSLPDQDDSQIEQQLLKVPLIPAGKRHILPVAGLRFTQFGKSRRHRMYYSVLIPLARGYAGNAAVPDWFIRFMSYDKPNNDWRFRKKSDEFPGKNLTMAFRWGIFHMAGDNASDAMRLMHAGDMTVPLTRIPV